MKTTYPRPLPAYRLPATGDRKAGFTLVEMLVVIVIIGVLVAMIIPAVLGARARARIVQCASNQTNLGKAIVQYDLNKGWFPGYANRVPGNFSDPAGLNREAAWPVMILPLLDREDVWDAFRRATAAAIADPPRIAEFVCPSDGQAAGDGASLSFAGNCGQPDAGETANVGAYTEYFGVPADAIPADWLANGVMFRHFSTAGSQPAGWVTVKITADDIKDGTSHTFLIGDCYGERIETLTDAGAQRGLPSWAASPATETQFAILWSQQILDGSSSIVPVALNTDAAIALTSESRQIWLPTSYHPGGVNMVFCDGHCEFISEDVDYKVYALQMTSKGAQVWMPGIATSDTAGQPPAWCSEPLSK